jgi:tRNA-splicing ligase RtcB
MRVPGVVLADERLLAQIRDDQTLEQLANATALPGVVGQALAMPDYHQGYGLPVGGVVATDYESGVISPGAIGFDINCGVRLLSSRLSEHELLRRQVRLADALYKAIPSGVGVRDGLDVDRRDLDALLAGGAAWAVEEGWGEPEDLDSIESGGRLVEADPDEVGKRAKDRGQNQVATLGAGNHFLEVQVVDEVYDAEAAANFAFANRQGLAHRARAAFKEVFGRDGRLAMVYDVCHNIAKRERHRVGPVEKELLVHRKGATRAFPAGHPELPARYRAVGQPVLIPGDMGRYSFVAVGTAGAMADTFGSICHGAGRNLSRNAAKRSLAGVDVAAELKKRGILVRTPSPSGLAEEASVAYKDVANVVDVCERAGIARKVVRLRPRVVIKG